jgi:hypothetical protein
MFQPLQGHLQGARNLITSIVYVCYYVIYHITADINSGCTVNVHYEPPEDGLVKAETYVGVKE